MFELVGAHWWSGYARDAFLMRTVIWLLRRRTHRSDYQKLLWDFMLEQEVCPEWCGIAVYRSDPRSR